MGTDFSYSKIGVYKQCPFKYKLIYVDGHYIKTDSVATTFGTLIHYIEERIGIDLKEGKPIDYDYYRNLFLNIELREEKETVLGCNLIKELYKTEWYALDKQGLSYEDKTSVYYDFGIYRLEEMLKTNPYLSIYALELPFTVNIKNKTFKGFIDRVFYDKDKDVYIIEDIKTYSKKITPKDLRESLQMYIYSMALKELLGPDTNVEGEYNLPLMNLIQSSPIDTKKIYENLETTLDNIGNELFHPQPTPLCHWCPFSKTYPGQPEEAKNLCPYFCKWTRDKKDMSVENYWQGESYHGIILERFINKENQT